MNQKIRNLVTRLGFTKYRRIENYITLLEGKFEIKRQHDLEMVNEINNLIKDTLKAVKVLGVVITISYFGVYFSLISAFFSGGAILSGVTETLGAIIGFFGTTLFIVLLFFSNKLSELYYQDLNLMTSHLITIYSKNKMKDEFLFEGDNSYEFFIKFFRESQ